VNARVIVISGSMGSGKTTVLGEASDVLSACRLAHGTIDLDAIGTVLLPNEVAHDLIYRNLRSIYGNFVSAGVTRVLLAEAVENRTELDRIRRAMPGAEFVVCRLTAAVETMQRRVRAREPGMLQEQFAARARELEHMLESAGLEDFTIANDQRSVTDVARELLQRAGWIPAPDCE
jgi:predicted kinase